MSHYSAAVITEKKPSLDDLKKAMAPFDENLEVPEYIESDYEEVKKYLVDYLKDVIPLIDPAEKEKIEDYQKLQGALKENKISQFVEINKKYRFFSKLDKSGNSLSTKNQKTKWDNWSIGGRWMNCFTDHKDQMPLKNYLTETELDKTEESNLKTLCPTSYKNYKWQLKRSNLKEGDDPEHIMSFREFLRNSTLMFTYAVLTPEGEWIEPGRMGYFGISTATKEAKQKYEDNYDLLISEMKEKYPDGWITFVDCHI